MKVILRAHSGEKPFPFNQSPKSFSQVLSLKSHLRTQSGEKSFPCNQCHKTFSVGGSLKKHLYGLYFEHN